jgi:hypothetical protein
MLHVGIPRSEGTKNTLSSMRICSNNVPITQSIEDGFKGRPT